MSIIFARGRAPVFPRPSVASRQRCSWQRIPWLFTLTQWNALNSALSAAPVTRAPSRMRGAWRQVTWNGHTYGLLTPGPVFRVGQSRSYFVLLCS
jgi:hypothetical protein